MAVKRRADEFDQFDSFTGTDLKRHTVERVEEAGDRVRLFCRDGSVHEFGRADRLRALN